MADMGIGETMLLGAAIGGGASALRGGNVAQGALMGGALGGLGAGIGSLAGGAAGAGADVTGQIGTDIASMQAAGASYSEVNQALMDTYGMTSAQADAAIQQAMQTGATTGGINVAAANALDKGMGIQSTIGAAPSSVTPSAPSVTDPQFMKDPLGWIGAHPLKAAGYGLGGYALANILGGGSLTRPNYLTPYQPVTAQQMGLTRTLSPAYTPQRNVMYNAAQGGKVPSYDGGGITVAPGSVATKGVAPSDLTRQQAPAGIQTLLNQYGITPQVAQQTLGSLGIRGMAAGGQLGGYSDGGRMLKGPGDGMSDTIPATIGGKQPARLADGEFVVPADVVSHLGNGSTDAGAKRLYGMMDKVRQARTGTKKQGKQIKADKYLPK